MVKEQQEVGLVVPAKYAAMISDKKVVKILLEELAKKKIINRNIFYCLPKCFLSLRNTNKG